MSLRLTGEAGVDFDDWRDCHNCGAAFKPDTDSRHHCSEQCAAACLRRRYSRPAYAWATEVD
jgi:predicted nucleic acid-binding Zn ribbon protein